MHKPAQNLLISSCKHFTPQGGQSALGGVKSLGDSNY